MSTQDNQDKKTEESLSSNIMPENDTDNIILDAENNKMLYVPKGCALGFQTLDDNVALNYHMSEYYQSSSSGGILWNDSDLNIKWPLVPTVISKKDLGLPTLKSII